MAELSAAGVLHLAGLAHLNHGLRGADSDRDAEFCARLAEDCGLALDVERCDVAASRRRARPIAGRGGARGALRISRTCPPAAAGRRRRRRPHARRSGRDGAAAARAWRRARGLTAIHPRRQHVIRPLIDLRRAELMAYLESHGRTWVVDDSNQDRRRRRNRLRHDVLPALVASEGDAVVNVLARTAEIAGADEALLAALARDAAARVLRRRGPGLRVNMVALARTSRWPCSAAWCSGCWRSCRSAPRRLRTSMRRCGFWSAAGRGSGASRRRRWNFPAAWGSYLVGPSPTPRPCRPLEPGGIAFVYPGELAVPEAGMRLAAPSGRRSRWPASAGDRCRDSGPAGAASRPGRPGLAAGRPDASSGGSGRKKVQDLFVDRKVPRAERHRVPIVTAADGRIVWVAGHAVAGGFGVTDATKSVVVLSFEPLGGNE